MAVYVQKYGGSSVATIEKIKAVAARVVARKREGHEVVVVVSAMGKTTDQLLIQAKEVTEKPPRRELDMLLSVGERVSMSLLSMAIQSLGEQAISFTGSQSGILTTSALSEARIVEVRPYRVQDELDAGKVVIVAGYQGVSYKREITTLGRGGSDTTAVALAAALGAEACEIYSDVDGVFSADPRVVESAAQLEALTYEEMQEMARLGAKVLNATAVEFARRAGIALFARSTHSEGRGTVVHGGGGHFHRVDGLDERIAAEEAGFGVRGVSGIEKGLWVSAPYALAGAILDYLSPFSTPYLNLSSSTLSLVVDLENVHDVTPLARCLEDVLGAEVSTGVGVVSAVGTRVGAKPRALAAGLSTLLAAEVEVMASRASGPSLSFVCRGSEVKRVTNLLHRVFLGPREAS